MGAAYWARVAVWGHGEWGALDHLRKRGGELVSGRSIRRQDARPWELGAGCLL